MRNITFYLPSISAAFFSFLWLFLVIYLPHIKHYSAFSNLSLLTNHFSAFLVINVLVAIVYNLSTSVAVSSGWTESDAIYNNYVDQEPGSSKEKEVGASAAEKVLHDQDDTAFHDKHMVLSRNANYNQRSDTAAPREMVMNNEHSLESEHMEKMDNEEFRMIVENFIAAKRKILREENISLLSGEIEG